MAGAPASTIVDFTSGNQGPGLKVNSDGSINVDTSGSAAGDLTPYRNLDVQVTGSIVKNTPGQLVSFVLSNAANAARFFKVYDKATAPTQADTPVMTIPLAAFSGSNGMFPNGLVFVNGISIRASTAVADSDTGAPTTNDVVANLGYK